MPEDDKMFETAKLWRMTMRKLAILRGLLGKSQAAVIDELVTRRLDEILPDWQERIKQLSESEDQK